MRLPDFQFFNFRINLIELLKQTSHCFFRNLLDPGLGIAVLVQYLAHTFSGAQWSIWAWVEEYQRFIAIFIGGLAISDLGHWVLDHV
mgnify:CR=1 FL=1